MANDLNVVALTGRLTRESELRYSNGGMAICRFSLASNYRTKKSDQWVDEANFFDCSMFGKAAEGISQYLDKGTRVAIQGELRQNRWEQDGQTRSKVEVIVNSLTLLGSPQDSQNQRQSAQTGNPAPKPVASNPEPVYSGPEQFDDDQIPF